MSEKKIILDGRKISTKEFKEIEKCIKTTDKKLKKLSENTYKTLIKLND